MNATALRARLLQFDDFASERGVLEDMLESLQRPQHLLRGVKYHPELMMIEQIWDVLKRRLRSELDGTYTGLPQRVLDVNEPIVRGVMVLFDWAKAQSLLKFG
jgi:hypothetical protein